MLLEYNGDSDVITIIITNKIINNMEKEEEGKGHNNRNTTDA